MKLKKFKENHPNNYKNRLVTPSSDIVKYWKNGKNHHHQMVIKFVMVELMQRHNFSQKDTVETLTKGYEQIIINVVLRNNYESNLSWWNDYIKNIKTVDDILKNTIFVPNKTPIR
jgi:hypothetical protein